MTEYVKLDEFEVFQVIEQFADDSFERVASETMSALPSRHYESETALKIRLALAKRKIAKYESEITRLMDLNRDAGRELARFLEEGITPIQLPHITKRKIQDLGNQIEAIKEEAKRFALQFGWKLVGNLDPETAEYTFEIVPMHEVFGRAC